MNMHMNQPMKTKTLSLLSASAAFILTGCATTAYEKDTSVPVPGHPGVTMQVSEADGNFQGLSKAATVFVEVKDNPELTQGLKQDLLKYGYLISEDKSAAFRSIDITIGFGFAKQLMKQETVNLGKLMHEGLDKEISQKAGSANLQNDLVINASTVAASFFDPGNYKVYMGLDVLSAVAEVGGVRSAFNKAIAGDARGFCLANCDKWNHYNQQVTINAVIRDTGRTGASVVRVSTKQSAEALEPIKLYQLALPEFKKQLLGSAAVAGKEAVK